MTGIREIMTDPNLTSKTVIGRLQEKHMREILGDELYESLDKESWKKYTTKT